MLKQMQRGELALTLMAITGSDDFDLCVKALEMSRDDINIAVNLMLDDPTRVVTELSNEKTKKEEKEKREKKEKETRTLALKEVEPENEKKMVKNDPYFSSLTMSLSTVGDTTISREALTTIILTKLDALVVESTCKIIRKEAKIGLVCDNELVRRFTNFFFVLTVFS